MIRDYQICSRCIMDTSDALIAFDSSGVCNHCRDYDRRASAELLSPEQSKEALLHLIDSIRRQGQGKPYDCVVGVSGGIDSTMAAYLVKKHGLRPLAVHLDNGWNSELSVHNIEQTVKHLQIDLLTYIINWEEFRDLQLAFFKASVANIEVLTDHAIMAILFQTAFQKGIKYIISGGNVATESIMPERWMYDARDFKHIKSIHRRFGQVPLKTYPHCSLVEYFYYIFAKRIKYVPILNLTQYVKNDAKSLLEKEMGWRDYGGKHYESTFTRFFQSYILPTKFQMDKRRPHFSSLICSGQMERNEALEEMKRPSCSESLITQDHDFFLKKMGLSRGEFEQLMKLEIKTHKDYPSYDFIFEKRPWIIKLVKRMAFPSEIKTGKIRSVGKETCRS